MSRSPDRAVPAGIRLQKVMAEAGIASRRASEELIRRGKVRVNGRVVTELGTRVRPDADTVEVNGRPLRPAAARTYILLNKPRGFVTTVQDERGRRTVLDLVKDVPGRLYPVGRLDYETEGLLLLTNDGPLTHALTHPRRRVPRTYLVEVAGAVSAETVARLSQGSLVLDDGPVRPAPVRVLGQAEGRTKLAITLTEGRNRQVRRMFEAAGHPVQFLKRVEFGPLSVQGVRLGAWRRLSQAEIVRLYEAAGLRHASAVKEGRPARRAGPRPRTRPVRLP